MNTSSISFDIESTGADLQLTVCLDNTVIYQGIAPTELQHIVHEFDDSIEAEHVLSFDLSGKLEEHTKLDEDGRIVSDSVVKVSGLAFDDIELGHMFTQVTKYHHDHNGTTAPIIDAFYGIMGCNGRVEMRFSTPIYLWLLENM